MEAFLVSERIFSSCFYSYPSNADRVIIQRCVFFFCSSETALGAIYFHETNVNIRISECEISNCQGVRTGGIYAHSVNGNVLINNICFSECKTNDRYLYNSFTISEVSQANINNVQIVDYKKTEFFIKHGNLNYFNYSGFTFTSLFTASQNSNISFMICNESYNITFAEGDNTISDSIFATYLKTSIIMDLSNACALFQNSYFYNGIGIMIYSVSESNIATFKDCLIPPIINGNIIKKNCTEKNLNYTGSFETHICKNIEINDQNDEITGLVRRRITVVDGIEYKIMNSMFINITSNGRGGAISYGRTYGFEIYFSTLEECVAESGGALFMKDTQLNRFSNNCFIRCSGIKYTSFYINNLNQRSISNLSLITITGENNQYSDDILFNSINSNNFNISNYKYRSSFPLIYIGNEIKYSYFSNFEQTQRLISIESELSSFESSSFVNITDEKNSYSLISTGISKTIILTLTNVHFINVSKSLINNSINYQCVNCTTNDKNNSEHYSILYKVTFSQNDVFPLNETFECYLYKTPPKDKDHRKEIIIGVSIGIVGILISIVILILFIKEKNKAEKLNSRMELNKNIINDFG